MASILRVLGAAVTAIVALATIHSEADASRLPYLLVVPTLVVAAASTAISFGRGLVHRPPSVWAVAERIRGNRPAMAHFVVADLSVYLYTSSDRLILYAFATPTVVGLYDAAYRLIQPFYGIATVASDTYYSRLANRASPAASQLFREYVDFMFFATIPLGFFTAAFAPLIVELVYGGDFAAADGYFAILGWAITFGFISGAAAFPFTVWNMPRQYNTTVTGGSVANLLLNLLLIPPLLGTGAALATVGGKVAATAIGVPLFRRASSYPIVRDVLVYGAWSAIAFAAGVATMVAVGGTVPIAGPAVFALVYVGGIGWQRLRYHLSPLRARLATSRSGPP
jgi:O-antigen/teichoic acid export membrane protein